MEWLPGVIAHEIVHWLLHWNVSYWNTLPIVVEEGLAQIEFHKNTNTVVPIEEADTQNPAWALDLTHEQYNASENRRASTYTGLHVAQQLGMDGLRSLALRAAKKNYETIPTAWIIEALARLPPK
jgi:hypothetical protein